MKEVPIFIQEKKNAVVVRLAMQSVLKKQSLW